MGTVALAAGVGVTFAMPAKFGFWRLLQFLLFWLAGLGFLQAKDKT